LTLMAEWYQQWHCHIWNCCDWKSPSSKCAKLRTVAACNNRDHASQSLLLLLVCDTYIYVLFFVHTPFVVNHTFNATLLERLQQHQF